MMILLAEIVLFLHVGYATFVLAGLVAVPPGAWLGWHWVRMGAFRRVHLICTVVVAVEALIGLTCPLTWLEHLLLLASGATGYDRSFIGYLLYWLLYYDAPAWVFTVAYTTVALAVVFLYAYVPPLPRANRRRPRKVVPHHS
jgi:hypothetical protein